MWENAIEYCSSFSSRTCVAIHPLPTTKDYITENFKEVFDGLVSKHSYATCVELFRGRTPQKDCRLATRKANKEANMAHHSRGISRFVRSDSDTPCNVNVQFNTDTLSSTLLCRKSTAAESEEDRHRGSGIACSDALFRPIVQ
ncbi:hypothetical protein CAPTEDRAFT_188105 [Capitella teleta]|uniref:Uncharacterized protein n=1 Tax=Capitella teleta TaxID=283909 RepID=R7TAW9_CAPTE|nr:hypothetical protein CAPTEDRAFT_188105 [Capitella teleta]|eukprot:ELT90839.1 hypothetical protein CAPTEDRAFT_188105 [Capitella teleta]